MNENNLLDNGLPIVSEYDKTFEHSDLSVVEQEAKKNNPIAIYELARRYHYGEGGVVQNIDKAMKLYQEVLKCQRNTDAMYRLGYLYSEGEMGEENISKCLDYFEVAISLGNPDAAVMLGIMYEYGELVNVDYDKALELYQFSINKGRNDAYYNLGEIYRRKELWNQAVTAYRKALDSGNMQAAFPMGVCYLNGLGVEQDDKKAVEFFELAYKDNDPNAPFFLGRMYFWGRGTKEDDVKAFQLMQEALEQEEDRAYLFLADIYRRGIDEQIEKNLNLAKEYLEKVPEELQPDSWLIKGQIYMEEHNYEKTLQCMINARNLGNKSANKMLELFIGDDCDTIQKKYPEIIKKAIEGNLQDCLKLAIIYMGTVPELGENLVNYNKMKFWANLCRNANSKEGDWCYAQYLSHWAKLERRNRAYDDTIKALKQSNEILLKLRTFGKYTEDTIDSLYYKNRWELGWATCYSNVTEKENLDQAYKYFQEVWENYPCSDALHGMAIISLHSDDYSNFIQFTAKALEYNKWLDNEMYANSLHCMGEIFMAQTNSKDKLENAYLHFSKAAELGYRESQEKLLHFHRTIFGKLKYDENKK